MKKSTDIVPVQSVYSLTINDDTTAQFASMVADGGRVDVTVLPRVKVPAGGALNWQLPDGSASRELRGVLILRHAVRAYWRESLEEGGGGAPPDCASIDAKIGVGNPGGECAVCPLNEWGSKGDNSNAKACRLITRLYLMRPGHRLPILFAAPPTALRGIENYAITLFDEGVHPMSIETVIGLEEVTAGKIKYSRPTFKRGEDLSAEDSKAIKTYAAQLIPALRGMPVSAEA